MLTKIIIIAVIIILSFLLIVIPCFEISDNKEWIKNRLEYHQKRGSSGDEDHFLKTAIERQKDCERNKVLVPIIALILILLTIII